MRCVRGFVQGASRCAGLVGAGRSEVMRAIFGLDPITSGAVYLNGREVHIRNTRDAINHGIAMVNEDRRTYSSSFLLLVNLHNTDCVFSFFFIAFPL